MFIVRVFTLFLDHKDFFCYFYYYYYIITIISRGVLLIFIANYRDKITKYVKARREATSNTREHNIILLSRYILL